MEFFFCQGSNLAQTVWKKLCTIPFGQITTYSQIAEAIGKPTASRSCGHIAVGKNIMPIVIPCHRVLRTDGNLGGFSQPVSTKSKTSELNSNKHFSNSKNRETRKKCEFKYFLPYNDSTHALGFYSFLHRKNSCSAFASAANRPRKQ
jgi:O-6-methylguanine DNA methyltransferase